MGMFGGFFAAAGAFLGTYGSAILTAVSLAASIVMQFAARGGPGATGPRLEDSTVTTSTYGNAIPLIIGRARVAGNMIWSTDIEELRLTNSGKGSMFKGPENVEYLYFGNFAMAFGSGGGDGCFAKLLADRKVIYDATGGSKAFHKYPGAAFRFYMGGPTQQPDPLMEADLGAGNVSAHRDLTYVVVENLPLKDFGNRIPTFDAEFDSSAEATYTRDDTTGTDLPDGTLQDARYDETTRQLYVVDGPSGATGSFSYIWRMDIGSNAQGAYLASTDPGPPYLFATEFGDSFGIVAGGVFPHTDGKVFIAGHTVDGDGLVRINPYTLTSMSAERYSINPPDGNGNFMEKASISVTRRHTTGIKNYLLLAHDPHASNIEAKIYIYDRDREYLSGPQLHIGSSNFAYGFDLNASCADHEGIVWLVGKDKNAAAGATGNRAQLVRIEINRTQKTILYGVPVADSAAEPEFEVIDLTSTGLNDPSAIAFDESSRSLIIASGELDSNNQHKWVRWDIASRSVVVERTFDEDTPAERGYRVSTSSAQSWQMNSAGGYLIAVCAGGGVSAVRRIRTVDLTDEEMTAPEDFNIRQRLLSDPTQNQAWFLPSATTTSPQLVQWERCAETPVPLETVLLELIELTRELGAADIDVTDAGVLAQDVRGLIIGRQMPVRRTLESLIFPFQLDIVESDGVLKFTTRGGASIRTIPEEDLGAAVDSKGAADRLVIDRAQEQEVPGRMDLRYLDWDREFLEGNQSAKRHRFPFSTQYSPEVAQLNVPVVMNAQEAAQAVEWGLYNAWVGRTGYKTALGTRHIALDPADVVTVERGDDSFLMRLIEWQLEDGFVTSISASSEDEESYISAADGVEVPTEDQDFGPPGATELFILDIPLLRDQDDTNLLGTGVYVAFGRHQAEWRSAVADRSLDGGMRWDAFSLSRDSSTWGFLSAAVAPLTLETDNTYPSEIQRLDEVTQITVQVVADAGDLAEISRPELWTNQENALIIGEGLTAELIRFQNFTDNLDGTYTLYNLLRGRRGTEEAALLGHAIGARVVFLDVDAVNREGIPLSRIAQTDFFRATSSGNFVEASVISSYQIAGNDLKPYAVARPEASALPGAGARTPFDITWNRRSRTGGNYDLYDGIQQAQIPVGEEDESYEVDLLDKVTGLPSGAVLTATDDATGVTINTTQHNAAGYSAGDPVDVVIYQISSVVGRGWPRAVTL